MNEKFNKNAKVEKFTNMLGIAVRLIVRDPFGLSIDKKMHADPSIASSHNMMHWWISWFCHSIMIFIHTLFYNFSKLLSIRCICGTSEAKCYIGITPPVCHALLNFWVKRSKVKVKFAVSVLHGFHTIPLLPFDVQKWFCVTHDLRRTPFDFGIKRSQVKVKFKVWTLHHSCTITLLLFDIQSCYFTQVAHDPAPLLIFGSKGQGQIWSINIASSSPNLYYPLTYNDDTSHVMHMTR